MPPIVLNPWYKFSYLAVKFHTELTVYQLKSLSILVFTQGVDVLGKLD